MDGGEVGRDRSPLAIAPIFIFSLSGLSQDVSHKLSTAWTPDEGSPLLAVRLGDLLLLCGGER